MNKQEVNIEYGKTVQLPSQMLTMRVMKARKGSQDPLRFSAIRFDHHKTYQGEIRSKSVAEAYLEHHGDNHEEN